MGDESDIGVIGDVWVVVGDDFPPLRVLQSGGFGGGSSLLEFWRFSPILERRESVLEVERESFFGFINWFRVWGLGFMV